MRAPHDGCIFAYYVLGIGTAVLTLLVLTALDRIERRISARAKTNPDDDTSRSDQR
jgi:hypothetical protein